MQVLSNIVPTKWFFNHQKNPHDQRAGMGKRLEAVLILLGMTVFFWPYQSAPLNADWHEKLIFLLIKVPADLPESGYHPDHLRDAGGAAAGVTLAADYE